MAEPNKNEKKMTAAEEEAFLLNSMTDEPKTTEKMQTQLTKSNESSGGMASPDATNNAITLKTEEPKKKVESRKKQGSKGKSKEETKPNVSVEDVIGQVEYENAIPTIEASDSKLSNVIDGITAEKDVKDIPTEPRDSMLGRYNFNLQHGMFTPFFQENWRKNAEIENQARPSLLKTQEDKAKSKAMANERAAQMHRNKIASNWDATWKAIDSGEFDDMPDGSFNEESAFAKLRGIAQSYANAGGDVNELTGHGLNRGGYKARNNADVRKAIANESIFANARRELYHDLTTLDANGRPLYLDLKSKYDPIINRIQAVIGGTGANMADADKIRVQYLYLPQERLDEFKKVFENYVDAMASLARTANKSMPKQKIDDANQGIAQAIEQIANSGSVQGRMAAGLQFVGRINMLEQELYNLEIAESSVKNIYDTYVKTLVMNAEIDPRILNEGLKQAQKQEGEKATELIRQMGGRRLATQSTIGIPTSTNMYGAYDKHYIPNSADISIPRSRPPQQLEDTKATIVNDAYTII